MLIQSCRQVERRGPDTKPVARTAAAVVASLCCVPAACTDGSGSDGTSRIFYSSIAAQGPIWRWHALLSKDRVLMFSIIPQSRQLLG